MNKIRFTMNAFVVVIFIMGFAALAQAQATRTWVSGVGDDANPCSRTAPCKTFAGAISKTANGGEISVLDPGGFGAVTITKSITLNGEGTLAGILAAGTNGIIVNAQPGDVVYIRYLTINGAGTGINGIRFLAGKELHVSHTAVYGFTGNALDLACSASSGGSFAFLDDVSINKLTGASSVGVRIASTSANNLTAEMDHVRGLRLPTGVQVDTRGHASIRDSVFVDGTTGIELVNNAAGTPTAIIENTMLNDNTTGIIAGTGSGTRLSQVTIIGCTTGISGVGSTVQSSGNNRIYQNTSDGVTPTIVNPK